MTWFPKKKVLVPIDFSDESMAAIDTALQVTDAPWDLIVAHVLSDLSPVEPGEIWLTVDRQQRIDNATRAIRERLADDKYAQVRVVVAIGESAHEVVQLAEREQVELIVMSSHGRTGVRRLMLGSVAEHIVRWAHCPVLVLKKPAK